MRAKHQKNILRLIVPLYNEESFLCSNPQVLKHFRGLSLLPGVEVFFAIGGGEDDSFEILKENFKGCESINVLKEKTPNPSVHKSVLIGATYGLTKYHYALICPIDVTISYQDVEKLNDFLFIESPNYGVFKKTYGGGPFLLKLQALYLNYWRLGVFKEFVWTNAPFLKRELLEEILIKEKWPDFLDDLFLSGELQKRGLRPVVFPSKVLVSLRRYQRQGILKQMIINLLVLVGSGLGIEKVALKKLYRKV